MTTFSPGLPIFYAVELDCYAPGTPGAAAGPGYGTGAHGALADSSTPAASMTIRASDVGYRTLPTDGGGPQVYPPLLASAFQISRAMNLDPTQSAVAALPTHLDRLGGEEHPACGIGSGR